MADKFTSVDEVQRIISEIQSAAASKGVSQSLGEFLRDLFEMEETAEAKYLAFARFAALGEKVLRDVEQITLSDARKRQIQGDASRIIGKLVGVGADFGLDNWKGNFDPSFLGPLNYVAMSLEGKVEYPDLRVEAEELADQIGAIGDQVLASGLPADLKAILTRRISELMSALRNIRIWGEEGLRREILLLSGELAMASAEKLPPKDRAILKKLKSGAVAGLALLGALALGVENTEKIAAGGQKLLAFLDSDEQD